MENFGVLEELRHIITRPELSEVPEDQLRPLLNSIKELAYMDKIYPIFQTDGFLCWLMTPLGGDRCEVDVTVLDKEHPYPTEDTIVSIALYYGAHGASRFYFHSDSDTGDYPDIPQGFTLLVSNPDSRPTFVELSGLSRRQARMLNLKAEGKTQKEIAVAEGISVTTVAMNLRRAGRSAKRYGFWQIRPEEVERPFSDEEYAKALTSHGKAKKPGSEK